MPARTHSDPTLDEAQEISALDETRDVEVPAIRREVAREGPQTPVETHSPSSSPKDTEPDPSRRRKVRWALFLLLPLALIIGGYWYVVGGREMSTDDAYVNAEKVGISTDVSGTVADVDVKENQEVAAGQVLIVVEAMKMENPLRAPHPGRVAGLHVAAGDTVAQGTVLGQVVPAGGGVPAGGTGERA